MTKYQITSPIADVRGVPDAAALRGKNETQLVFGEVFDVSEEKDGWCKGACGHDGYTGYIDSQYLSKDITTPTHIVTSARSNIYRDDSIKSPLISTLSFGSLLTLIEETEKYARLDTGEWIYKKDIAVGNSKDTDYVATALKFLETPYFWGGRSGFGIDCSGLVQVALARAGIPAPRDTEQQISEIGKAVDTPQRGDIVFFPGHVGIMVDDDHILHANGFHMKVTVEPLKIVTERSEKITGIRRP